MTAPLYRTEPVSCPDGRSLYFTLDYNPLHKAYVITFVRTHDRTPTGWVTVPTEQQGREMIEAYITALSPA